MKTYCLICIAAVFVASCAEEMVKKPEDLIPEEKMTEILYDLAIINSAKNTSAEILRENNIETMFFIFEKYKIDSAQFVRSDVYYSSLPLQYEAIYKGVEKKLEEKKKEIDALMKIQMDSTSKKTDKKASSLKNTIKEDED
ncbi:DUF4296 domain-containing protein [Costertonia aggregata]|uniref:DUF4296 domain-containing protein n=1 Tax=Costertonia aggregata TaxID=343403 RepID=A0A7H9AQJ6_9FLAO|nr:DUF4296 domain-containing protein [Costertonia aggregata]QLG45687.1 DUF4296 domain-containing protein [Costertonia aggregata]